MAATVEGAFVILDRATGPMERMERQAKKTDLAVRQLGDRLDKIGTPAQLQRFERTERAMRNVDRASNSTTKAVDGQSRSMDRASRSAGTLTDKLIRTGAALTSVGRIIGVAKFGVLAAGIGLAVSAVNALAAGAISLTPKLVDLGGAAAALPATFLGVGLAVAATKMAFSGLDKAMGGNKEAIKALTPEARQFMDTLKGMQPVVKDLRRSAQQGLFPGLDASIQQLRRAAPMAGRLLHRAGFAAGRAANSAAARLTDPARLRDIEHLGNQGVRVFSRIGAGATNLAEALIDVAYAAEPFTRWLSTTLLRGTKWIEVQARMGRENGRLAAYFDRTRDSLERMASIGSNLFNVMRNIGRASRRTGDDMWESIDRTTQKWEEWTGSLRGQHELRMWFERSRAPLREFAGLIGDVGEAIFRFDDRGGLTTTLQTLRRSIPSLQRFFESMAQAGPGLAELFRQLVDLAVPLAGGIGVFTQFLTVLTNILGVVNDLIEEVPIFGNVMTAALTAAAAWKLRAALLSVAVAWKLVGRSAQTAGAASVAATGATAAAGGAGLLGMLRGRGGPTALPGGGTRQPIGAVMGTRATMHAERQMMRQAGINPNSPAALAGTAGTAARGAGGAMRGALGAAGRIAGPLALFGAGLGALQGTGGEGIGGLGRNIASGLSFGLVESTATRRAAREQRDAASLERMIASYQGARGVGGNQRAIRQMERARAKIVDERSGEEQRRLTDAIDAEIRARKDMMPLLRAEKAARSRERGGEQAENIGKAFRTDLRRDPQSAFKHLRSNVLGPGGMGNRDFPGARQVAEQSLQMAREAAKGNPKLQREYEKLEKGVRARFDSMGRHVVVANGRILSASARDWPRIRERIAKPAEQARQRASSAFSAIQRAAIGALRDMGYSQGQATGIVRRAHGRGAPNAPDAGTTAPNLKTPGATSPGANPILSNPLGGGGVNPNLTGDGIGDGLGNALMGGQGRTGNTPRNAGQGGGNLMGAKSGLGPYAADAASYGLSVSSGLRPGSITNSGNRSYHASGDALDLAGPPAAMMAFARHAADAYGAQLEELIYTPMGFSIKNGQRVPPYAQADHYDHVHLADAQAAGALTGMGAGGGTGLAVPQIKLDAPTSGVQGVSGVLADTAMAAMTVGLEQRINERLSANAGTGMAVQAGSGTWAAQLAAVGLPPIFNAIIKAESGGDPGAKNPSGASGLLQIMMPLHAALVARYGGNVFDPMTNLRVGKHLYDESGLLPWAASRGGWGGAAQGDGIGWGGAFGEGGAMRVRKPTLFLAGDSGDETVRVQRSTQRKGGGGRAGITIGTINVENHRAGDIKEQIRAEVEAAFDELADEYEGMGVEDEEALL